MPHVAQLLMPWVHQVPSRLWEEPIQSGGSIV
jgi:hypothetical protein